MRAAPLHPTPTPLILPLLRLELADLHRLVFQLNRAARNCGTGGAGVTGEGVLEPVDVVALGEVVAEVRAPALGAGERGKRSHLG